LEEQHAKQRLEEELDVARRIQQSLLPRHLPEEGWFVVCGSSVSTYQVGGDYYDVVAVGPETWSLVVADVSGKGVSSALLASFLQGAFLSPTSATDIPEVLSRINTFLSDRSEHGKYATMFYSNLDSAGRLTYANAGHCAPLVVRMTGERRTGEIEKLEASSLPVGLLPETRFVPDCGDLAPGDRIVLHTDGVTEAQNYEGDFSESGVSPTPFRAPAARVAPNFMPRFKRRCSTSPRGPSRQTISRWLWWSIAAARDIPCAKTLVFATIYKSQTGEPCSPTGTPSLRREEQAVIDPGPAAELYIEATVVLSADVRFLPAMRHTIGSLTAILGWNDLESRAITLAVEEALTNKIRHAYGYRSEGRIQFQFRTEPGALVFQLTDQGEPPDPAKICARERDSLQPGGFGTHIMKDVMDQVVYRTTEEGNHVILTKHLPANTHTQEGQR
jgi:anti-sigma regulatory factor (Ser/Thr protein kinase)